MANARSTKTVKTAPAAKKTVALKAKKVRAVAQTADTKKLVSEPVMPEAVKAVQDNVKKAAAEVSEKATDMLKDANTRAKKAFEKGSEVMKDIVEFNKANLEAIAESGKIAAKGAQTATQNAVEIGRRNWETTVAHTKELTAVKAPADFVKMQSEFARKQFDATVADFSKATEFYVKLAGDVVAPIQNRYSVVAKQMKDRVAA
jgi:phasin family protein